MRAIVARQFGGPEVLRLETLPDPAPGGGQVLLRVAAAGVNPVDVYILGGGYAVRPELPYTPGWDAAGEVVAAGAGVTSPRVGERVYTAAALGAYAELALAPADRVFSLPANISFAQGAALGVPYGTAHRALFVRGRARPGDWCLVHGASGGVGVAATQLARAAGLSVVGTAGGEEGLSLVAANGAHHALNHHDPHYREQALALTGGRGFDLIVEMLANVNLGHDLPLLAPGGAVVVVGSRGPVEINPRDAMSRETAILGMTLMRANSDDLRRAHAALLPGLESGALRPVVGRSFPLAAAAEAQRAVMNPGARGKIVLTP